MSNSKSIIPLENNEFKARTLDELIHVVESFFANKGSKPIIIAEDNSVIVIMEDAVYEKAVSDFQQASDLCNRGKFSQAKPILDTIIKECPSFSEAYRLKAQIAKMEGNIDKAVDVNLDALCCDPNNNWALVLMGNLLMEKEDYDGAKGYFERVIKNDAHNALALSNAGMCLIKQERSVESLDYFERALQQDETYANVYYGYALAYSMLEQYDRAFEMARVGMIKSVDKPENPGAKKQLQQLFIHIAQACVSVYDYSKILKDYQNQIQHKTTYPIEFVQDESIKVDAQLRIAQQHNAKRHVVVYRNKNKYKVHLVMHELTHLSMALDAMNNGRLKNVMSGQTQYRTFSNHYEVFFQKLKKRIGEADAESVLRQLYDGLVMYSQEASCMMRP